MQAHLKHDAYKPLSRLSSKNKANPLLSRSILGGELTKSRTRTINPDTFDPTTDTTSYDTAPELSEPVEQLFEALKRQETTTMDKGRTVFADPF